MFQNFLCLLRHASLKFFALHRYALGGFDGFFLNLSSIIVHTPCLYRDYNLTFLTLTANFELKFLLNFIDIWKKVIKKQTSDLDKRKKYEKLHKLAGKSVSRKKRWKGSVLVVLAQNLFYNWKFQFKISVKTSAKPWGFLSLIVLVFFTLL